MSRLRGRLVRGIVFLVLALYTALAAGPFAWMALLSVRNSAEISENALGWPTSWHWAKYVEAWTRFSYGTYFKNSVLVVGSAVALTTIIGAMAAYCFARMRFRLNRTLFYIIFSALIFPPQITIIALFQQLVEYDLFDRLEGLILVYVSLQIPLTVYILETFFRGIPADLSEAARIDGCSEWGTFRRVMLPIAWPAVVTVVILNFILLWNEFLYAAVLISDEANRTLPLGIQQFQGDQNEDIGMVATGMMIAVIPVLLCYMVFSRQLIRSMTAGAIK